MWRGSAERRGTGIATPSSRRRVDGVEDDATIQDERAVNLISTQVAGQVFDKKRIEYLCKQDMMLPVFRAAGTSGEVRLPFQDLRFYLSKTIR